MSISKLFAERWQPIATLHRIDTDVVLWNPCDGVHLLSAMISLRKLNELREGKIYTHWRKLDPPQHATSVRGGE